MKFGVVIAANSSCLHLDLDLSSSFSVGVVSILLSRFDPLFKCTAD